MRRIRLGAALTFATASVVGVARADDPFPTRAERIMSPGRSAATEDSSEALVLNPANLANAPGTELRWTGVRCPDTQRVACGHAVNLALPLFGGLTTGLRVDYVMPPGGREGVGFPYNGVDYTWLTWGLGYKLSSSLQVGASLQGTYSQNPYTDGLFGISAGASWRPYSRLGISLVAHDFNGPSMQKLPPSGYPVMDRTYVAAMSLRPTGTRAIDLGFEMRYFDGADQWRPRGVASFDIPGVGRVRADVEAANLGNDRTRGVLATAGAELYFDHLSLGGGALFGSALGDDQAIGQYATASISSYTSPGIPRSDRAVSIRLESTPGNRSHMRLLRRLWRIAEDREIKAVTMVLRSEPATSYAHAEELADAFRVLRANGKKVVCSFEDAGPKALYACASADRIVVNPAGGVRYAGLKTSHLYLAGMLAKLGVKAEFVRIGDHKLAPEQYTNERASDVARADQEEMLRNYEAVFARNMALYRKIPETKFREVSAKGPFVASEAKDAGLVDGFAFDDELERVTQDVVGRKIGYQKFQDELKAPERFGPRDRVGILYIDGDIIDGRSQTIPLLDTKLVGSYTIVDEIDKLRKNPYVKSVVVRIESPGGSSMASDVMWRALKKLQEKKPVIVSMGSVAASGGYYVAAPAKTIFALPLSVTGSIGIFYGKADISGLLGKVGVNVEVRKTTGRADAESFFRGFTDDERVELNRKVKQFYDVFLDRVAEGRRMTKAQVDAVGQGRVWAGQQALEKGLVDRMGGMRQALEEARRVGKLPSDAPVEEHPPVQTTLLDYALELAGFNVSAGGLDVASLPSSVRTLLRGVAPLLAYGDGQAMARMEWMPEDVASGIADDQEF